MQFLVLGYDGKDEGAIDRRMAVREAHLALGDTMRSAGQMLYAAAMLTEEGVMCGSMIVLDVASRAAVDEWLAKEPYVTGKVWERIEVMPCKVGPSFQR
ncbi:MAG: hypothetical protein KDD69_17185 [Bdellovibrionales bacterium]|nr:hypothetical protein [Bdellovibrionales bacterium]